MVLKVSISLPGDALITFEASEPQVFSEVANLALKELPRDLWELHRGSTVPVTVLESGKNVISVVAGREESGSGTNGPDSPVSLDSSNQPGRTKGAEEAFAQFCASLSPVGDMRRVVVAIEGARRFLGKGEVSEKELGALFDLAGWRKPGNFVQTLRNASRSKFQWLERVRGKAGYHTVTETGRQRVIGPNAG